MAGAVEFHIDARAMQEFHATLKKLGNGLHVELRRGVKAAAAPIVNGIKGRASFSPRIARSIKAKPNFSARNPGVSVIADAKVAPEAAPINNRGRSGTFRHPVFGNRDNWADETAHPFMQPTAGEISAAEKAIGAVMDDVARKAGFQ